MCRYFALEPRKWLFTDISAEHGQDLLEYGLLASLIAIVAMGAITFLGQQINQVMWQTIVNNF